MNRHFRFVQIDVNIPFLSRAQGFRMLLISFIKTTAEAVDPTTDQMSNLNIQFVVAIFSMLLTDASFHIAFGYPGN